MGFQESVRQCLQKYANFNGRATRSEYWWFNLFVYLSYFTLALLSTYSSDVFTILFGVFIFGMILPLLAVSVRRLHDTNKSGWMLLLSFIPIVNLVLIYFFVQPSEQQANQYGELPAN
jgi:uncharacterized membrane protein YhaH (DUF805 family)